jgi:hypothetical protein
VENQPFSTVWQPFVGESPLGNLLPERVSFPYFIEGAEHHALKVGSVIELGGKQLLLGILIGYDNSPPFALPASKVQMRAELAGLAAVRGQPPLEILLLNAAAYLREQYGGLGHEALRTAMAVLPTSAMIKSDYLMSLWALIQQNEDPDSSAMLEEFAEIFPNVELPLINPEIAEQLVCNELLVLTVLNRREERNRLVQGQAATYIVGEQAARTVAALLAT